MNNRLRIAIADDDALNRDFLRRMLLRMGHEVVCSAEDGKELADCCLQLVPDLVISDVNMPRMDGIELVKLIKEDQKLRHLPVMIVSYKDREEDRKRGLDAGADYYLTKGSFYDDTLQKAVAKLIGTAKV